MATVSGSQQPQVPWDEQSPWDVRASQSDLPACPGEPPGVEFPDEIFSRLSTRFSLRRRLLWAELPWPYISKLSPELFHAFPVHSQASGCTKAKRVFAEFVEY